MGAGGQCVWSWCTCVSSSCQQGPPSACTSWAACVWGFGEVGVFLGRGREGLGSVWVLSLVSFLIPSPRPVLIPTGKPELSRPVDSEWLSVCLQAGEQLSSRAKIWLTPEHLHLGKNEKYLSLLSAVTWTKVSIWIIELKQPNSVLLGQSWMWLVAWEHLENWGRKQTGRPYFKLGLIDPYNNFIQRQDSNILLTQFYVHLASLSHIVTFSWWDKAPQNQRNLGFGEKKTVALECFICSFGSARRWLLIS